MGNCGSESIGGSSNSGGTGFVKPDCVCVVGYDAPLGGTTEYLRHAIGASPQTRASDITMHLFAGTSVLPDNPARLPHATVPTGNFERRHPRGASQLSRELRDAAEYARLTSQPALPTASQAAWTVVGQTICVNAVRSGGTRHAVTPDKTAKNRPRITAKTAKTEPYISRNSASFRNR
jgi:hypothetical protein